MAPFSRKPAVVIIQPSDHSTDIESAIDRVELERCTGHLCAIGDNRSLNDRTKQLGAFLKSKTLETTS